ncbi:MAG: phosphatase, partial [Gammaproteobacteria bacterium]|nr:phosphatase [Gammaproteobacteria bacterium]
MKADLHCHSYFSDGKHSPDFLLKRAEFNKISHLAITDHDFAFKPELAEAQESNVRLVSGVEISCKWQTREIHIVGIGIDPEHNVLDSLLLTQRQNRKLRV